MSDKQIQRIKTALSDGSCESVTVMNIDEPHEDYATTLSNSDMYLLNRGESWLGEPDVESLIHSVKYNRRTYADLNVGDIVDTPDGKGVVEISNKSRYWVFFLNTGISTIYPRHELILLEKAND